MPRGLASVASTPIRWGDMTIPTESAAQPTTPLRDRVPAATPVVPADTAELRWRPATFDDLDRLMEAMQVLNMARLYVKGRGRPGKPGQAPQTGQEWLDRDAAMRAALKEMRRGGVDLARIPAAAMALLEDAHTPPEGDNPAFKPRGPRRRK